jgi:hypothetical protein
MNVDTGLLMLLSTAVQNHRPPSYRAGNLITPERRTGTSRILLPCCGLRGGP